MPSKRRTPPGTRLVDLLVDGAAELVTIADLPDRPRTGSEQGRIGLVPDGAVAVDRGSIVATGPADEVRWRYRGRRRVDARGKTVLPGFVDPHTHPVFAATREGEFEARIEGKSYQEIAAAGGGILSSVRALRAASRSELTRLVRLRLDRFLALGTTTVEAKSGYGLSTADELKSLEALRDASRSHPVEIVPTFLGAHEVPAEFRADRGGYLRLLVREMLPLVRKRRLAESVDVFCEKGVFDLEESRTILREAARLGFRLRLHADELSYLGGAELAAEIRALSADHLVRVSDRGIRRMKRAGTIAVLLPGSSFLLRLPSDAPARRLIDARVPVALGTDFNPGTCYTQSMPAILNLAAVRLRMKPAEAIVAATLNAAHSLGRGERVGSLHPGKQADIIVCDVPNHRHLAYEFGRNPVEIVIKKGKIVFRHA